MEIDRELQRNLLKQLKDAYPLPAYSSDLAKKLEVGHLKLCSNAAYLEGHGLIVADFKVTSDGTNTIRPCKIKITASGIDFIEEDGGLTAILGVLTVKLHAETIRDLIIAKIEAAEVECSVKEQLKASVRNLPAKGLEAVVTRLAQEGLAQMPNAMQWLQSAISVAL